MRKTLLDALPRRVAACDHLDRGVESILLNIAHASSSWDRIVYLGNTPYRTKGGNLFSHEDLDVYQTELRFIAWLERMSSQFTCSSDLLSKLDKSTTSIILNTAEGNGRFFGKDQARFPGIAYLQGNRAILAALLDLTAADSCPTALSPVEEGRDLLR